MTGTAINRRHLLRMRKLFRVHFRVTTRALQRGVRRRSQGSLVKSRRHSRLPLDHEGTDFVAIQTRRAAGKGLALLGMENPHRQGKGRNSEEKSKARTMRFKDFHTNCPTTEDSAGGIHNACCVGAIRVPTNWRCAEDSTLLSHFIFERVEFCGTGTARVALEAEEERPGATKCP